MAATKLRSAAMQTAPHCPPTTPTDPSPEAALARLQPPFPGTAIAWQALSGGRTNRVWRVGDLIVKRHHPDASSPLFPNDPLAERQALFHFAPLGLAPRLRAHGDDWLICDHLPAGRWTGPPAAIAGMLHRLHNAPPPPFALRPLPNGSRALLAHAIGFAPQGALPAPPADPGLAPVAPRPVHADAVAGNILGTPKGPVLIDWQCPGLGDPSEDLATLLSPAMMWLYTGRIAPPDWADALLDAYPDPQTAARTRSLWPLYRWRILAHCAWKAARGDADYAQALRIDLSAPCPVTP